MSQVSFAAVPRTAEDHFDLLTRSAGLAVVAELRSRHTDDELQELLTRFPCLAECLRSCTAHMTSGLRWRNLGPSWLSALVGWEAGLDAPMTRLDRAGLTDPPARLALAVAALVDVDSRFGPVLDHLQAPLAGGRPTLRSVAIVLRFAGATNPAAGGRALVDAGLLELLDTDGLAGDQRVRVPAAVLDALSRSSTAQQPIGGPEPCLPEETLDTLRRAAGELAAGRLDLLVLRGPHGSDREPAARYVATCGGAGLVREAAAAPNLRRPGPWLATAAATGRWTMTVFDPVPGQLVALPEPGPVPALVVLGPDGGVDPAGSARRVVVEVPRLDASLRRRRWRSSLSELRLADETTVVERFHLPGGLIDAVARTAEAAALVDGADTIATGRVRAAVREEADRLLGPLANRLAPVDGWGALVVSDRVRHQLDDLARRCRHREALAGLAPSAGAGSLGVRAMFTGPSGTGKTLAARALAAELGLDVYRVDLAAIFDKYVGETEKNLHRVLSRAEQLDVVLLVDEGDSLFGGRTAVRSANDRYANLETNYLLQRIETYDGIVVVTTNERGNVDTAFARRMDAAVAFPAPSASQRLSIWRTHLPATHALPGDQLELLAVTHPLTGGQIRNAVAHAALLALDGAQGGSSAPIDRRHVDAAVAAEYHKSGAMAPGTGPAADPVSAKLTALMDPP